MWITISKTLPVENPPPMLSVFWGEEYPEDSARGVDDILEHAIKLWNRHKGKPLKSHKMKYALHQAYNALSELITDQPELAYRDLIDEDNEKVRTLLKDEVTTSHFLGMKGGYEQNWVGSRKIIYGDETIRVFPSEYTCTKIETFNNVIIGYEGAYEMRFNSVAGKELERNALDGENRPIYEASLVDGASHPQALANALGYDVVTHIYDATEAGYPPPLGWYCPHISIVEEFSYDWRIWEHVCPAN